jgi:hypothetical protein
MHIWELIKWAAVAAVALFDLVGLTAVVLMAIHVGMNYRRRSRGEAEQSLEEFMTALGLRP